MDEASCHHLRSKIHRNVDGTTRSMSFMLGLLEKIVLVIVVTDLYFRELGVGIGAIDPIRTKRVMAFA